MRRPTRRVRWIIRAGVLFLVIGFFVFFGFDSKFYYPDRQVRCSPADYRLQYEEITIPTPDGLSLHGWFLPATEDPRGTVVHFHGNAGNVTAHLDLVDWIPRAGYNLLMFDYRGYGRSQGKINRAGTVIDGRAAVDYALSRPDVDPNRLFAFGQSLGGAVAIVVAAQRPQIRAVAVESTFSSYRAVAALHAKSIVFSEALAELFALAAISNGHDPIDVVQSIAPRPILIMAADQDSICPPALSRELFEAAGEPKNFWLMTNAEHLEGSYAHRQEAKERISETFEAGAALAAAPPP